MAEKRMISRYGESQIITDDMVEIPADVDGVEEYFLVEIFAENDKTRAKIAEEEFPTYPKDEQLLWTMAKYSEPKNEYSVSCHVRKFYRYCINF